MPGTHRKGFVWIALLMLLAALGEVAAIASLLPFLSLLSGSATTVPYGFGETLTRFGLPEAIYRVEGAALLFGGLALTAGVLRLLLSWISARFVSRVGHDLSVELTRRILFQPYSYHIQSNSSEALAALNKTQIVASVVFQQMMQGLTALVITCFIIATLFSIDAMAAGAAVVAFGGSYLLVSNFVSARLARNSGEAGVTHGRRLQTLQEGLGGIRDVIIDRSHTVFLDAFRAVDRRFAEAQASNWFIVTAPRFVIEMIGMVVIAAIAMVLARGTGGLVSATPILGAVALGGIRLLPSVQQLYASWASIFGNRLTIEQVEAILRLPVPTEWDEAADPFPFVRDIMLDQVCFAYASGARLAVNGVTATIPVGAWVALVGPSGSGKSTLADLLMGLLEPSSGEILIDGEALASKNRAAWRLSLAHVPQFIFLSDDSVARNVAFGVSPEAIDHDRVAEAIAIAQLDKLIAELPAGLETRIGESGVRLSGGQRQRLGIARAVYKNAPVIILDEATNALDERTEAAVLDGIAKLPGQRTVIIISHRRDTVARCQFTLRLEDGELQA